MRNTADTDTDTDAKRIGHGYCATPLFAPQTLCENCALSATKTHSPRFVDKLDGSASQLMLAFVRMQAPGYFVPLPLYVVQRCMGNRNQPFHHFSRPLHLIADAKP